MLHYFGSIVAPGILTCDDDYGADDTIMIMVIMMMMMMLMTMMMMMMRAIMITMTMMMVIMLTDNMISFPLYCLLAVTLSQKGENIAIVSSASLSASSSSKLSS